MATSRSTSPFLSARARLGAAAGMLLAVAVACGTGTESVDGGASQDAAPACASLLPSSCPRAPSYANDVAPLVKRVCLPCHSPGGVAAERDLTTYKNLLRLESTALVQVNQCFMPPADAGATSAWTSDERTLLLQWFVCGSPDN